MENTEQLLKFFTDSKHFVGIQSSDEFTMELDQIEEVFRIFIETGKNYLDDFFNIYSVGYLERFTYTKERYNEINASLDRLREDNIIKDSEVIYILRELSREYLKKINS